MLGFCWRGKGYTVMGQVERRNFTLGNGTWKSRLEDEILLESLCAGIMCPSKGGIKMFLL